MDSNQIAEVFNYILSEMPVTMEQIAEGTGIEYQRVRSAIVNLITGGYIRQSGETEANHDRLFSVVMREI
jgi:hypothetical protein